MSDIETTSTLRFDGDSFLAELRRVEAETTAWAARMNRVAVNIPMTPQQHVDRAIGSLSAGTRPGAGGMAMSAGGAVARAPLHVPAAARGWDNTIAPLVPPSSLGSGGATSAAVATSGAAGGGAGGGTTRLFGARVPAGAALGAGIGVAAYGGMELGRAVRQRYDINQIGRRGESLEDQVQSHLAATAGDTDGLSPRYWMRKGASKAGIADDPDDIRDTLERASREAEREKRHIATRRHAVKEARDLEVRVAAQVQGTAAARAMVLEDWVKGQEKLANDTRAAGGTAEAKRILDRTYQIAAFERANINRQVAAEGAESTAVIGRFNRAGEMAQLRTAGRGREADLKEQEQAIIDAAAEKRRQAEATESDAERPKRMAEAKAAEDAVPKMLEAIRAEETRRRTIEARGTDDVVASERARAHVAGLIGQNRPHQASLAMQEQASYERARGAFREFQNATSEDRGQKFRQWWATGLAEVATRAAAAATEVKRVKDSLADLRLAGDRTLLSLSPNDSGLRRRISEQEWTDRLAGARTSDERAALIEQQRLSNEVEDIRRVRGFSDITRGAEATRMRAGGQRAMGDLMDYARGVERRMQAAGGDMDLRRSTLMEARAGMQQMAAGAMQPSRHSSWADFVGTAQNAALDGLGNVLPLMQQLYSHYGRGMSGTKADQDRAMTDAASDLRKTADSLAKQTVFVLKD